MAAGYAPVPTDDPEYPPRSGWVRRSPREPRERRWRVARVALWTVAGMAAVHYVVLLAASVGSGGMGIRTIPGSVDGASGTASGVEEEEGIPQHPLPDPNIECLAPAADFGAGDGMSNLTTAAAADLVAALASAPGAMKRDATPMATAQQFLALAEAEVAAMGLDTCGDELGRKLLDDAARGRVVWCAAEDGGNASTTTLQEADTVLPGTADADTLLASAAAAPPRVECMPLRVPWWPARYVPCLSRHLRPVQRIQQRQFLAPGCERTHAGDAATNGAAPPFIGRQIVREGGEGDAPPKCDVVLGHTVVFIQRQDKWNPFHVAEDLVMALTSMLVAAAAVPSLAHHRVQLAFLDNLAVEQDRFAAVWERVGAIPPRRTRVEPYQDGTCLTTAVHSVFGLRSLFSAQGVARPYSCASTLAWAASHYYRHLFGLVPRTAIDHASVLAHTPLGPPQTINVLYLSRASLRDYMQDDFGDWQRHRELMNEDALVARLRRGLRELCTADADDIECVFEDADVRPETWAQPSTDGRTRVRFMMMDPTGHALETQVHRVGHTDVLVGQHGGALGLSLFMHPGAGTILELAVPFVRPSQHFQHMAFEMGHAYNRVHISRSVDVEGVWAELRDAVLRQARGAKN